MVWPGGAGLLQDSDAYSNPYPIVRSFSGAAVLESGRAPLLRIAASIPRQIHDVLGSGEGQRPEADGVQHVEDGGCSSIDIMDVCVD
jgi:hypothetical protein